MKLFKTKSVLSVFVTTQTNITIAKINTINIINLEKNAPKVLLYNLKTLKFSPAKSILLQFLSLIIKLLIKKFFIQKTDLRKKGNKEDFLLPNEKKQRSQKRPTPWFCKSCMQKEIPFSNINDTEYTHLTKDSKVKPKK